MDRSSDAMLYTCTRCDQLYGGGPRTLYEMIKIADIMFLIKSLKNPSSHFNNLNFITFNISNTRLSSYLKLCHSVCKSNIQGHFYFHRIPRLWNSLPLIDTSLSIRSIRAQLRHHFWNHFIVNFDSNHLITFVHA